ncbi:MAG: hypothetical protein PHU71_05935 [Candidatus Gracilibacteria bacterium]|nr:hypothetical protein [Candidatus Gracilibacteria bacterium]
MPIGEIIETSTRNCIAQSYELDAAPSLGALVKMGEIYGVVCEVRTLSIDPSRKPQALGNGTKNLAEILAQQPQLKSLLRTEFEIRLVGSDLPDRPPALHAQVEEVAGDSLKEDLAYLRYLKDLSGDVIVKHLKLLVGQDEELKLAAAKKISTILMQDLEKLDELLERLQ